MLAASRRSVQMEMNKSLEFVEELDQTDWFANWENTVLEYTGGVTELLFIHHREEYNQWNRLVDEVKEKHLPYGNSGKVRNVEFLIL